MLITPKHAKQFNYIPQGKIKIIACDTEDDSKGKTLIYNFFDGENHYTTRKYSDVEKYLLNQNQRTEIWCANLNYDIGNLFKFDNSYHLAIKNVGSRFISVKSYVFKKITFKDIFNVMPGQSVKKLGGLIGLPKIETDDFNNIEYCQRDTEIVFWALVQFREQLREMGIQLKTTAASTSFTALSDQVPILKHSKISLKDNMFLRSGYYGGRTEVFRTNKITQTIYSYDIVSSYPSSMTELKIPNTRFKSNKFLIENQGMSDVTITAPKTLHIPYLPKKDDKLIFPLGKWRGVYTHFELRESIKLGYEIQKVHKSISYYQNEEQNLSDWVNQLFNKRNEYKKNKNEIMSYILKILLNSCYGKFGQGLEFTKLTPLDLNNPVIGGELFPNNQLLIKEIKDQFEPYTNFYLASLITAKSRHKLYKYLVLDPEHTIYCDTDSIFTTKEIPKKYLSNELGGLEFQGKYAEARFIQPKVYYIKDLKGNEFYKCKGVWGDLARKYFTEGHVDKIQPLKYVETCRKNFYKAKRRENYLDFNLWVNKTKSKKSEYDKRIIFDSGETRPLIINERR